MDAHILWFYRYLTISIYSTRQWFIERHFPPLHGQQNAPSFLITWELLRDRLGWLWAGGVTAIPHCWKTLRKFGGDIMWYPHEPWTIAISNQTLIIEEKRIRSLVGLVDIRLESPWWLFKLPILPVKGSPFASNSHCPLEIFHVAMENPPSHLVRGFSAMFDFQRVHMFVSYDFPMLVPTPCKP